MIHTLQHRSQHRLNHRSNASRLGFGSRLTRIVFLMTLLSSFSLFFVSGCASHSQLKKSGVPENEFVRAAAKGDVKALESAMKNGMNPNTINAAGTTAAMAAASRGQIKVLQLLIEKGARLDYSDAGGDNVWSFAITAHLPDVVQFLVNQRLNPNLPVYQDLSPLFIAVLQGQTEIVRILLSAGASADFNTDSGGPLHTSLRMVAPEISQLLIDAGAPINRQDPDGETPLMIAAATGQIPMIQLLLSHGAKKDVRAKNGKSAKDLALFNGHIDAAELLEKP